MAGPVHYEVFTRKAPQSSWALELAVESREQAVQTADELLADKRCVAVRITKETLDVETMEFNSITILTKGVPEPARPKAARDDKAMMACTSPTDLYAPHARQLVGRVLEDWLARNRITPFELLHRADVVETLEASGLEMQHAIQKVAVPESQATGQPVHDIIRHYQRLIEKASERLTRADRKGVFPDLETEPVADIARRLINEPERAFLMGGAVAKALARVRGWRAKVEVLMDIADTAPDEPGPGALVHVAVEQAAGEVLALREGLADVLGPSLDLGGQLAALVCMAAPDEVEILSRADVQFAAAMPSLDGPALRVGRHMAQGQYRLLAGGLSRRVLRELMGPRRLRPSDPSGEIEILRALAMVLTAAAGRFLTLEEAQLAFAERSKALVSADFVEAYVGSAASPLQEAELLVRLCENVTGGSAKRSAARWLSAAITALRFERSLRESDMGAGQRLAILADLQSRVRACGLNERDETEICDSLGRIGDAVEADGKVSAQLARAQAPVGQRLTLLLRMASGLSCPIGPAADRAKAEALKLLRQPDSRATLSNEPQTLATLRPLMQSAGLAA